MQKRIFTFLFLIATVLSYSTFAEAALQFLPRYQGGYGTRTQQGGRDKVCDSIYQYACSGSGYAGGVGTSCNDLYPSCSCSTNYKWSGGSCVLKSCSDYGYSASKDNTKSCEEKTPRSNLTCYSCTACDNTYQYACSGTGYASTQENTKKCGNKYSECSCVEHASWNSTSGKCECGSDYKAGTTSCTLKTCEDYGYSVTEDTTKNCTKQTPRSGLTCWNCSDCTGTLYDCSSMANASGGSGTACGGKYPQCTCKDLYRWDNGTCKLNCTRNSCSTTTYPLTAQNAANASSYEKCTPSCSDEAPRYKVSACASGYSVNSNGSGCVDDCGEYLQGNWISVTDETTYYTDCETLGGFGYGGAYYGRKTCGNKTYAQCLYCDDQIKGSSKDPCPAGQEAVDAAGNPVDSGMYFGCHLCKEVQPEDCSAYKKYPWLTADSRYSHDNLCGLTFAGYASYSGESKVCGGDTYIRCACIEGYSWNSSSENCRSVCSTPFVYSSSYKSCICSSSDFTSVGCPTGGVCLHCTSDYGNGTYKKYYLQGCDGAQGYQRDGNTCKKICTKVTYTCNGVTYCCGSPVENLVGQPDPCANYKRLCSVV